MADDKKVNEAYLMDIPKRVEEAYQANEERVRNFVDHYVGAMSEADRKLFMGASEATRVEMLQKLFGMSENASSGFAKLYNNLLKGTYTYGSAASQVAGWDGVNPDDVIKLVSETTVQTPEQGGGGEDGTAKRQDITAQIQAFIDEMRGPIKADDPIAISLQQAGMNAAEKVSANRGVRGGLAAHSAVKASQNALVPYQQNRESLLAQGLQLANNREQGLAQLAMGWDQLQMQKTAQANQMTQAQGQGIGGAIGTGIGLVGAGIASAYGGAALAPAIVSGAAAAGAGLGGLVTPQKQASYGGNPYRTRSGSGGGYGTPS